MICFCQLCGAMIQGRKPAGLVPVIMDETATAAAELGEFDLMAAAMLAHLTQHREHAIEAASVQFLAGKMFAMRWARTHDGKIIAMRDAWRAGILQALSEMKHAEEFQRAAAPGAGEEGA